jgi:hypothetical protein
LVAPKNAYQVLGIPRGASDDHVRDVQQRAAKAYHSDTNRFDAAKEQRLKKINAAAAELRDPARRAALDRRLAEEDRIREGEEAARARAATAPAAHPRPSPLPPQSIWDLEPATFVAEKITETSGTTGKVIGHVVGKIADVGWKIAVASMLAKQQVATRGTRDRRCRAKTKYGDRCRNYALDRNKGYCAVHA